MTRYHGQHADTGEDDTEMFAGIVAELEAEEPPQPHRAPWWAPGGQAMSPDRAEQVSRCLDLLWAGGDVDHAVVILRAAPDAPDIERKWGELGTRRWTRLAIAGAPPVLEGKVVTRPRRSRAAGRRTGGTR